MPAGSVFGNGVEMRAVFGLAGLALVALIMGINLKRLLSQQARTPVTSVASQAQAARTQVQAIQQQLNNAMAAAAARQASASE